MLAPPPVPTEPMPRAIGPEWAKWHLRFSFTPDDAVIIEWLTLWPLHIQRQSQYAAVCHAMKWHGWQARLAWEVMEAMHPEDLPTDDDIPF